MTHSFRIYKIIGVLMIGVSCIMIDKFNDEPASHKKRSMVAEDLFLQQTEQAYGNTSIKYTPIMMHDNIQIEFNPFGTPEELKQLLSSCDMKLNVLNGDVKGFSNPISSSKETHFKLKDKANVDTQAFTYCMDGRLANNQLDLDKLEPLKTAEEFKGADILHDKIRDIELLGLLTSQDALELVKIMGDYQSKIKTNKP